MRRHYGKGNLALCKDVSNGELTAISIAAVSEVHLTDFVGISLEENRNSSVAKSLECAVLIGKNGHRENNAIEFTLVLCEPLSIKSTLVARLNAAKARRLLIHHNIIVTSLGNGFDDIFTSI